MQRGWVNFKYRGVLLIVLIEGQGPTALAVDAGGGCLDIFLSSIISSLLSPSLWETVRLRLKYCLKEPLNPKQPTNQLAASVSHSWFPSLSSISECTDCCGWVLDVCRLACNLVGWLVVLGLTAL